MLRQLFNDSRCTFRPGYETVVGGTCSCRFECERIAGREPWPLTAVVMSPLNIARVDVRELLLGAKDTYHVWRVDVDAERGALAVRAVGLDGKVFDRVTRQYA